MRKTTEIQSNLVDLFNTDYQYLVDLIFLFNHVKSMDENINYSKPEMVNAIRMLKGDLQIFITSQKTKIKNEQRNEKGEKYVKF